VRNREFNAQEFPMPQMIFVNLPVADLPRAKAFYESIGARNEPKLTYF
jgi:predicted lactoylglutathione lyase